VSACAGRPSSSSWATTARGRARRWPTRWPAHARRPPCCSPARGAPSATATPRPATGCSTAAEPLLARTPGDAEARSWLLLAARAGRPWPAWAGATLRATERLAGEALLLRLEETAPSADRASLAAELEAGARRRDVAAAAARRLPALLGDVPAGAADGAARALVPARRRARRGARRDARHARRGPRERGRVARQGAAEGALVLGPEAGARAVPVLPGALSLVPDRGRGRHARRPFGLSLLLAALTLCTVLGSWRVLVAQRRETKALAARAEFLTSVTTS
jgi:hypothetical protein